MSARSGLIPGRTIGSDRRFNSNAVDIALTPTTLRLNALTLIPALPFYAVAVECQALDRCSRVQALDAIAPLTTPPTGGASRYTSHPQRPDGRRRVLRVAVDRRPASAALTPLVEGVMSADGLRQALLTPFVTSLSHAVAAASAGAAVVLLADAPEHVRAVAMGGGPGGAVVRAPRSTR